MSGRGKPRKARVEHPGESLTKSTPPNEEQAEKKKPTRRLSKVQQSQQDTRKSPRTASKEVAPSGRVSKSTKTTDADVSYTPKVPESQVVRVKDSVKDAGLSALRRSSSVNMNPTKVLHTALERLKVKKQQRSESASCVNDIQSKIAEYLKQHLDWCRHLSILKTGSYYENLKICKPDEFDVMLTVPVDRVNIERFSRDAAFYSVEMKRHAENPLDKFVNRDQTIKASEMLNEFREKVKDAVATLSYNIDVQKKKKGCPAVTLLVKEKNNISIDLVLGLEVHSSWPYFITEGFRIEKWLGKKVRMEQRRKPFYLVPKYEGRGTAEQDGIRAKDTWRISFSHVEKYILKNHGNSKTCCEGEQKCCRKQCLKLMKYLFQRLKEKYPEEADKLCSYHAKTTLLHACAAREKDSDWAFGDLSHCFQQLLRDFEKSLKDCMLPNFFIPSHNLISGISKKYCSLLAGHIESERNNMFPLLW